MFVNILLFLGLFSPAYNETTCNNNQAVPAGGPARGWGYTGQPIWSWHPFWWDPVISLACFWRRTKHRQKVCFFLRNCHQIIWKLCCFCWAKMKYLYFPNIDQMGIWCLLTTLIHFHFKPFFELDHWYFDVQQLRYVFENVFRLDHPVTTLPFLTCALLVVAILGGTGCTTSRHVNRIIHIYVYIYIHIHICTIQLW